MQGYIFNIQRYSIHDGPGIRTTVFVKGCPLHCAWCHNPEAMGFGFELGLQPERCINCRECVAVCENGVHSFTVDGTHVIHREYCKGCGECVEVCYAQALEGIGRTVTVDEALAEVERDRPFYATSGGGMTISGGEPLRQPDFARELLRRCREQGIHTALDTSGFAPYPLLRSVAEHADLVLYDIKHMDSARHRELTGVPNEVILENLRRLYADEWPGEIWIRFPFVPTLNGQDENVEAMGRFLADLTADGRRGKLHVDVLPYHPLGTSKYRKLGLDYALSELRTPEREVTDRVTAALAARGLDAKAG
jgi:pyruvate formate lyase activating enzyme